MSIKCVRERRKTALLNVSNVPIVAARVFFSLDQARTKKALDRISCVYRDNSRTGGGNRRSNVSRVGAANHRGLPRSTSEGAAGSTNTHVELPNVAAVARFAIERERLAREMGLDELGGPATLGVVNVGAHGQDRGCDSKTGASSKQVKHPRRGRSTVNGSGSGGNGGKNATCKNDVVEEETSAGEILLEKLESIAEARSIEVKEYVSVFLKRKATEDFSEIDLTLSRFVFCLRSEHLCITGQTHK